MLGLRPAWDMDLRDPTYLLALGATLASEAPLVWWLLHRRAAAGRLALAFLAGNLFTHGLLWTLWPTLPGSYGVRLVVAEGAVVLVEGLIYGGLAGAGWRRGLATSLVANAASTVFGLVMWWGLARLGIGLGD